MKHEGAWVEETDDGRVVVYLGDDQANEYIYRYVSNRAVAQALASGVTRSTTGSCTSPGSTPTAPATGCRSRPTTRRSPAFASQADILINARAAADAVGATKMDRPEWIDVIDSQEGGVRHPHQQHRRGTGTNPASTPPTRAPSTSTATSSAGATRTTSATPSSTGTSSPWPAIPADPDHGSTIVGDKYGSPDGLYVAPSGRLWIQTDVSGSTIDTGAYAGFGNNQMLCADPTTKETRRFLVGPNSARSPACFVTPDEKTLFVGIQHPGEAPTARPTTRPTRRQFSSWPDGAGRRPAAVGAPRHHQGRRRQDRHLTGARHPHSVQAKQDVARGSWGVHPAENASRRRIRRVTGTCSPRDGWLREQHRLRRHRHP